MPGPSAAGRTPTNSCTDARLSRTATAVSIFLLEADAAVRDAVAAALEAHGMQVQAFAHAAPFLATALPPGPVCLVIDRALPPAGGSAVLRELKERGDRLAAVLMTGLLDPTLEDTVQQLLKPFGQDELVRAIERALVACGGTEDT